MSPQAIRGICVSGFVILCVATAIAVEPQKTIEISPVVTVTTNEVDRELQSLLNQRYEAAKREAESHAALYRGGKSAIDYACDSIGRLANAGIEAAETPEDRVKRCEAALKMAREVEESVTDKFKNEVEPVQAVARASYTRLDIEIKLHRARKAAGK